MLDDLDDLYDAARRQRRFLLYEAYRRGPVWVSPTTISAILDYLRACQGEKELNDLHHRGIAEEQPPPQMHIIPSLDERGFPDEWTGVGESVLDEHKTAFFPRHKTEGEEPHA